MKPSTQQRVLEMSAELFNRYGIEAVTIGQIADALEISSGNLTYHFEKKADLVAEHVNVLERALKTAIDQFPIVSNARTFSNAYVDLLRVTLRHRFVFVGANYVMQNDLLDPARYQQLIDTIKGSFVGQTRRLIAEGFMSPILKPYSIGMLIDCIWWQWLGWLLAMQITPPVRRPPERKLLADAVLHIFFLNHHYVDKDFFKAVQVELKRLSVTRP